MASDNSTGIQYTIYKGSKNGKLVQATAQRDRLMGEEVLLRVTHSSLCGTDEHYLKADMCLGHECAGTVEQLGPGVKSLKVYVPHRCEKPRNSVVPPFPHLSFLPETIRTKN